MKTNKQQGFTLIELIIVIVILGILAVTASPKFLDLTGDARASTVSGLEGSVKGAANIIYSKALIAGVAAGDGFIDTDNDNALDAGAEVETTNGYPDASANGILLALELNSAVANGAAGSAGNAEWEYTIAGTTIRFYPSGSFDGDDAAAFANDVACYVSYSAAAAGVAPVIISDTTGC